MLRLLSRLLGDRREPLPCDRPGCPAGIHYHYGYGQRHSSKTPQTGPNDFSDGQPFIKEGPRSGVRD